MHLHYRWIYFLHGMISASHTGNVPIQSSEKIYDEKIIIFLLKRQKRQKSSFVLYIQIHHLINEKTASPQCPVMNLVENMVYTEDLQRCCCLPTSQLSAT